MKMRKVMMFHLEEMTSPARDILIYLILLIYKNGNISLSRSNLRDEQMMNFS